MRCSRPRAGRGHRSPARARSSAPRNAPRRQRRSRRTRATPTAVPFGSAPALERAREVLEGLLRLRLLLAREVDALLREVRAGLGRDLERLARRGPRRELEDARTVRVDPHLRDEPAAEIFGRDAVLEDEDRPEHGEAVEVDPRRMLRVVGALLLREELPQRAL